MTIAQYLIYPYPFVQDFIVNGIKVLRRLTYIIGQLTGALSGIGVWALWSFAMWGPTAILSLSGTSFAGAFVMSMLAIAAVIASVRGHAGALMVIFFFSFCPIGFFFLSEAHWLSWTGILNLGYLVGGALMWKTRKLTVTNQT